MAHMLDESNNRINFAFTGDRKKIWHGLGTEMSEDTPIDIWKVQAGLDWEIKESNVVFNDGIDVHTFDDKKVLFRSDTKKPLSVVGKEFKVVQPVEIIEFFRELVEKNDMKLSSAGSLFGGKRFWALAELGKSFEIVSGDKIDGYLLLTTSADGTLCTTAKFTSTRVVCNNTLSISLGTKGADVVKVSHRSEFDANKVKLDLGLIDDSWFNFTQNIKSLLEKPINDANARKFYLELITEENKNHTEATRADLRKVDKLVDLYKNGLGADMSRGTYWGVLNGLTEMYTHGTGNRNASHQFWDSYYGGSDNLKNKAFNKLLAA